jgi:nucleoid-associated protein EbfC
MTVKMPGNMGNMQAMMKQAQKMQEQLKQQIAAIRVEASTGGGMVTVKMDGEKHVLEVKIDPEAAGDVEMLQDMVLAAFNEAAKKVDDESQGKMSGMLGGLGLPPGMF